jgi:hypothetical protein
MSTFVKAGLIAVLASTVGMALASVNVVKPTGLRLETGSDSKHDTSRPMRDILAEAGPTAPVLGVSTPRVNYFLSVEELTGSRSAEPPLDYVRKIQSFTTGVPAPDVGVAFNGLAGSESGGARPPDTTGDVSPTHYFEWVNSRWMLFDKATGARLLASPANGNSFFAGFGGLCESTNRGDPLVLWDDSAQRWVVSQFAFVSSQAPGTFLQCVAVSTTSDPLGTYHRYQFTYPLFNDYGKMAVWRTQDGKQNAYTMTMHEFTAANPNVFQGTSFSAIERDKMLQGLPAKFIRVGGISAFGGLPFHLEGNNPMPSAICPQFIDRVNTGNGYRLWNFCLDWNAGTTNFTDTPTIQATEQYFQDVAAAPQAGASVKLDAIGNHTMYMASMRAYDPTGPAEATGVINHSVNVGNGRSGIRWAQLGYAPREVLLDSPGARAGFGFESDTQLATRIIDQGTYAPGTDYRWMAAINQDKSGNIGLAYNATGYGTTATGATTTNTQIRHSARARTDAPGVLRDENAGGFVGDCTPTTTGAQTIAATATERWGDYSMTSVDPSDDCTFWHAGEYYAVTSASNWNTRICSFKLAECGQPDFVLETTPGDRLAFCASPNVAPTVNVRIGALGAFAGNTALTATGFPGGVTATFGTSSLAPGASTTLGLVGATSAAPGIYSGTITAVNGITRTRSISFGVSSATPLAPVPATPASGSTGASIRPFLTWNSAPDAISYTIELSLNAGFAPILETGTSATNSFVPVTLLTSNTQYFWRVKQTNFCGVGATSAVASFTTGVPLVCAAGTTDNRVFFDDMSNDSIAWVAQHIAGDATKLWAKGTPPAGTGITTRAWFNGNSDTNGVGDQRLTSPPIVLPVAARRPITLSFDAHHQFETDGAANCWDGGLVEISTDNGLTFSALGNSRTLTDVYPGILSGGPGQGQSAWCRQATPGTAVKSSFTLDQFAGQTVLLRFRASADDNTAGSAPAGWAIDNIEVKGCQ